MSSNGKVAIVTGGGSGIGKAAALALVGEGYSVAVAGRRSEPLEFGPGGGRRCRLPGPARANGTLAILQPWPRLFEKTVEAFGRLDVLFNNAGRGAPPVLLEELTYQQWQEVLDVNLTGSFLCTQEAFKIMKRQEPMGGRIINNGSISAHVPRPNSAPYTSTKHAITGLTRATSLDGRKYDIACGQIDIGNAATEMTSRMQRGVPQANGAVMVEPTMNVQNVADAVVYMAGLPPDANVQFITVMATKMPYVGRG